MANTTLIEYEDKGFWINEAFIEVLSDFLCKAFQNLGLQTFTTNLNRLYMNLDGNRTGDYTGFVGMSLDEYIVLPIDRSQFSTVLSEAKRLIALEGFQISIAKLNQFEMSKTSPEVRSTWTLPILTQSLSTTIDFITQLINGTWPYTIKSVHYVGFPDDNAGLNI